MPSIFNFAAAHELLYKIGTQTTGKYPNIHLEEPAEELMIAIFGGIVPVDEQRLRYLMFDLYQYAKSISWDGGRTDLRNFDGYNPGGFNRKQRAAWCADSHLSAWRKCLKSLNPEVTADMNDSVACVAQDVARTFLHVFDSEFGLSMWEVQMAAIKHNSEELSRLKAANRTLFVYPQLAELLTKRGFRVRQ